MDKPALLPVVQGSVANREWSHPAPRADRLSAARLRIPFAELTRAHDADHLLLIVVHGVIGVFAGLVLLSGRWVSDSDAFYALSLALGLIVGVGGQRALQKSARWQTEDRPWYSGAFCLGLVLPVLALLVI